MFACDPIAAGAGDLGRHAGGASTDMPVFAKLSPDVTDIVAIARAVADAGADGLSLINTLLGHGHRPGHDAAGAGRGHRWAVRAGHPPGRAPLRLAGAPGDAAVPLIGMGGVTTGQDALEFLLAGACGGLVGTAISTTRRSGPDPGRAGRRLDARGFARWPTRSASPTRVLSSRRRCAVLRTSRVSA